MFTLIYVFLYVFIQSFHFNMEVPVLSSLTAFHLIFQFSHLSLTSVFTMLSLPINLHNVGY